ncbi:phage late control D family protein [Streptomyces phaeochromogenes]|uniref:phage late control D family protein n=1 Tax=Streptomyces phaeochromogenes TaxID=1923 RepID=UPI0036C9DF7E
MADFGVRLQLLLGPTVVRPAPYDVMNALIDVEVLNSDQRADAFRMTFALGKDGFSDYGLLREGYFDPPARVSIAVVMAGSFDVLVNGIVTDNQVAPSGRPGESTLVVTGDDLSFDLTLTERSTTFPDQSDSDIVEKILNDYGLRPKVTATKDKPSEKERLPTWQGNDLACVRSLARRNGFVFFVEPTGIPGISTAYWGPQPRGGGSQPALSTGMGPDSNVDGVISFDFNAAGPATPQVTILDPLTGLTIEIPVPSGLLAALSGRPAAALRTVVARDVAGLDPVQAALRALTTAGESSDAVTGRGELDAVRYGSVLRPRRLVGVRGAGLGYDGEYYVQEVTHLLRVGSYRQSFVLTREGLGATSPRVAVS